MTDDMTLEQCPCPCCVFIISTSPVCYLFMIYIRMIYTPAESTFDKKSLKSKEGETERERKRESAHERERESESAHERERDRERERGSERERARETE